MMRNRIMIKQADIVGNRLLLHANESIDHLKPAEQILVDSDHFSFIYLMESQEEYTYIVIPEPFWPLLKSALEQKNTAWITNDGTQVELTQFHEELEYVVSNIKDNSNYGEEMVTRVDDIF